jgi:uroporphyrinogen decarboxylase
MKHNIKKLTTKENEMTSKEIIKQNIEYNCDERIGFSFSTEGWMNDFDGAGIEHGIETKKWIEGNVEYHTDIWGNLWHRFTDMSAGGEVLKPVLEEWSDLDKLELPELSKPEFYKSARKVAENNDKFTIGYLPGWVFAIARYMRTMEIYFMDLVVEREHIDILHDKITTLLEGVIEQYGKTGLDAVMFCEDLGIQDRTLIGPDMWRDIYRKHYERLTAKAHEYDMKVIQHSCGYNWALIDDLCEAGIDCLQFDQPAVYDQIELAKKLKKHKVGLFSPCDIQKVLPTGDRDLIEKETKRLVNNFRGGFIAKNYGDLHGIGVDPEWDKWAYDTFVENQY